jgi:dTDP-N-acetylfucosamine:lipid II N-acetylfucosaminyltransferase
MIVHLFEDQKFVDVTIDNFENISKGKSRYIVFSDSTLLKYVSKVDQVEIFANSCKELNIDSILKDCKLLIIHSLSPLKLYILKRTSKNITVVWSVWGADAYPYFYKKNLYEPLTDKVERSSIKQLIKSTFIYNIYHFHKYRVFPVNKETGTLKKINYLITVLPYEYELIKNEFQLRAKYLDYNYGINRFNEQNFPQLGDSVLLGNSSDYSNNHLDIFEFIKDCDKKLIVPLSYAGYRSYRDLVIKEGDKIFNTLFNPILEFIPLEKYNQLILSCNSVIMYHIRQQALGNIFMSLFQGMRVFLNKKSITYKYMQDVGMIIFDLENDVDLVGVELQEKQKIKNRELVIKLRGEKIIINKTQEIYKLYNTL